MLISVYRHTWDECRPLSLDGIPRELLDHSLIQLAWSVISCTDRQLFHEYQCLCVRDDLCSGAAGRITRVFRVLLGAPS